MSAESSSVGGPVLMTITTGQLDDAIAGAERRGAVKALHWLADDLKRTGPDAATRDLVNAIHADARRIESGEVTL